MKVNYIGPVGNLSGYSDAARNYICALDAVGVRVDVTPISFEPFKSDLGAIGNKVKKLIVQSSTAPIQINHNTPQMFERLKAPGKYNIGVCAWETSRLPEEWVPSVNSMNEVWVPTEYNKRVFENSGVVIPIRPIPHTFNVDIFLQESGELNIPGINPGDYVFYSIAQWTERKNFPSLLKAYLTEFTASDQVALVLKTYMVDPTNPVEKQKIIDQIKSVKASLYLRNTPKIILVSDMLSKPQINALNSMGDCYVSAHRSEGWGIPITEAFMAGNTAIATNHGGPKEFMKEEFSFPVDYMLTPVSGMPWDFYRGNQVWAEVNIMSFREKMRYVYENRDRAKEMGSLAQAFVRNNYSWQKVGEAIKNRLEEVV